MQQKELWLRLQRSLTNRQTLQARRWNEALPAGTRSLAVACVALPT